VRALQQPFPYYGSKAAVAGRVWGWFGACKNYVEPFAGGAAMLLGRPPECMTDNMVETINDADGMVQNFWRAAKYAPDRVAEVAEIPLMELELHASQDYLAGVAGTLTAGLRESLEYYDTRIAGLWLYVMCGAIGYGMSNARSLPYLMPPKGIFRVSHREHKGGLVEYIRALSNRLKYVRITCGDWKRVLGPAVLWQDACVFLDPPYLESKGKLYSHQDTSVSSQVRDWCIAHPNVKIVLCGYNDEHDALLEHGWTVVDGQAAGPGVKHTSAHPKQERLWCSPRVRA
jgi:hypothetical protein